MQAVKAVKQNYLPSREILTLLEVFRLMVNDCITIGFMENVSSLKSLSLKAYRKLSGYKVPSYYKLCAISKACGILRNYRKALRKNPKARKPHARKLMLTTCYGFKVRGGQVSLPLGHREHVDIPLTPHTRSVLEDPRITVRSICLTACTLSVAFSKEAAVVDTHGAIGIDRNLDNVTIAGSDGSIQRFDLSEASRIKAAYRAVKSHFRRNDVRIRRKIYGKYGLKERNRVSQMLHRVSKKIVEKAKDSKSAVVMEKLTGIRKLYRRGNGQGRSYRFRLNSWSFYELQRQIEYKAKWEGIPVIYVPPRKTSSTCAICGSEILECAGRVVYCPQCRALVDRDVNAARNILARGLRFGPVALPGEAMVPERGKPIRKVDGSELSLRDKT
jgi:putative transposase